MRYSAKCMSRCQRNDGEKDTSDDAFCVILGASFTLLLLLTLIIRTPPGTSRQIRMNTVLSFSKARSSPGIAHQLRIAESCECRRRDPQRSGIVLHPPLVVPVEVGSQDVLRILGSECPFFFILVPPVNSIGFVALLILEETVFVLNGTAVGLAKNAKFCRSE